MAIAISGLTKKFGSHTAVDDLSFSVELGTVTGFLGPNGAGKSTAMRCMLDLDPKDSGSVIFDGSRFGDLDQPIRTVGSLLDSTAFDPNRSARSHLRYLAAAGGLPKSRVDEVLGLTGLHEVSKRHVGNFSLGMHQRLGIAAAVLGDPKYMFLDEPTNGLDPEGIKWVRQFLREMADEGRGILVSSHLLTELELYVDHLVVIGKGRMLAQGSVHDLKGQQVATVTVRAPEWVRLTELLTQRGATCTPTVSNTFEVDGVPAELIGDLAALEHIAVHELHTEEVTLEAAFLDITRSSQEYKSGGAQ
jgi:ABC-2 type transport system ATP-binding protein